MLPLEDEPTYTPIPGYATQRKFSIVKTTIVLISITAIIYGAYRLGQLMYDMIAPPVPSDPVQESFRRIGIDDPAAALTVALKPALTVSNPNLNPFSRPVISITQPHGPHQSVTIKAIPIQFDITPYNGVSLFRLFQSLSSHYSSQTTRNLPNLNAFLQMVFHLSNTYTTTGAQRRHPGRLHTPNQLISGTPLIIPIDITTP